MQLHVFIEGSLIPARHVEDLITLHAGGNQRILGEFDDDLLTLIRFDVDRRRTLRRVRVAHRFQSGGDGAEILRVKITIERNLRRLRRKRRHRGKGHDHGGHDGTEGNLLGVVEFAPEFLELIQNVCEKFGHGLRPLFLCWPDLTLPGQKYKKKIMSRQEKKRGAATRGSQ